MVDIINLLIKNLIIFLCSFYIYVKITNYRKITINKIVIIIINCTTIDFLYYIFRVYIPIPFLILILCFISSIVVSILTENKIDYSITAMTISLGISFISFIISTTFTIILTKMLLKLEIDDFSSMLIILFFTTTIIYYFFKIRRFKKGFPFLHNKYISGIGIFFSGITLMLYTVIGNYKSDVYNTLILIGLGICAIGVIIWIRNGITIIYKEKMKAHTIKLLEEELTEKDKIIAKISTENSTLAFANHKINKKLSAMELFVKKLAYHSTLQKIDDDDEIDYTDVIEQIITMSNEYSNDIIQNSPRNKKIATTNIISIDAIFEYMLIESTKNNIDFNLKINSSINYMIQKIIPKNQLETLIGDHIEDAIIAINASTNIHRSILVFLGVLNEYYAFCVYDSGIEFEIDTLLSLGLKTVTTHSDTGGSGIGFMTTFKMMKECGASLIIEEKSAPCDTDFTKSITIRFDSLNQYIIKSYRANEIRNCSNEDNRIIIMDYE